MKSDEITVERLRSALRNVVLKGDHRLPSNEALRVLAANLERLRQAVLDNVEENRSVRGDVLRHIEALRELLPILQDQDESIAEEIREMACAMHRVDQSISPSRHMWYWEGWGSTGWADYAELLAGWFGEAVRSTNPDLTLGLSKEGPVARFVYTVVPWITREKLPSVQAVAQAMIRRAEKRRAPLPDWV